MINLNDYGLRKVSKIIKTPLNGDVPNPEIESLQESIKKFSADTINPYQGGQKGFFISKENLLKMANELIGNENGVIFWHGIKELPDSWGGLSVVTIAQNVQMGQENGAFKVMSEGDMNVSFEAFVGSTEPPVLGIPPANP